MKTAACALLAGLLLSLPAGRAADEPGWITLFNGKDTSGWKLRTDKYTKVTYVDAKGNLIKGGRETKLDQTLQAVDAKNRPIADAKFAKVNGKDIAVDAGDKPIPDARVIKVGGRPAVVDAKNIEFPDAKKIVETISHPTGSWKVENGALICGVEPHGTDLFTEQKFGDFQLHVEFLGSSNSGVYLQGRYEIQVDNSINEKLKIVEIDGKKVESLSKTMCGALYSQIAPTKNMAKKPDEWQTFDITFKAARGEKGKVASKARVTLVWNGEKVIDDAEIPNGTALEPGPILLQGDHGKVTFRNIRIKPLDAK